jgi:hypothetical protein
VARSTFFARAHGIVRALFACLVVAALVTPAAPVQAWGGGGDWYGTHDWIVDGALQVLDGRVDSWFNAQVARDASGLPDMDPVSYQSFEMSHIYKNGSKRGGAIHAVATEFDLAQAAYRTGADARAAGDETAARAAFDVASHHVGLLSHYLGDISQPFHTNLAGDGKDKLHHDFEYLVNHAMPNAGSHPEWRSTRRTLNTVTNVRRTALAEASYSRSYYSSLYTRLTTDGVRLTSRLSSIVGALMKHVTGSLADVIWAVQQGTGAQPAIGSLKVSVRYIGVRSGGAEVVSVSATDVNGKPIEGLRVAVAWPTATGHRTELLFTDAYGKQVRYGHASTTPARTILSVTASTTVRGIATTAGTHWVISPRLPSGTSGFRTSVDDTLVVVGQTVHVVSLVRDANGNGVRNLTVVWTWDFGGRVVKTRAFTDSTGRARSSQLILPSTPLTRVYVTARVQSYSVTYTSKASFRRAY